MRHKNDRIIAMVFVAAFGALGMASGSLVGQRSAANACCEYNVCFTEDGNCDHSDIVSNCQETFAEGCESYECETIKPCVE